MAHETLDIIDRIDVGIPGPNGEPGKKGDKGETGTTPDLTLTASIGTNTGTPTINVTKTGTPEAPTYALAFDGLKAESVKPATAETAGVVKPGANLTITADGTLDAPNTTIITNTDALPTGLPKGSVVIQLGNGEAKFYVEDGKEGA